MNKYKASPQLKNAAKDKLAGNYGNAVLITFLNSLIGFGINFFVMMLYAITDASAYAITGQTAVNTGLYVFFFILTVIISIVLGVLQLGLFLYFLKVSCGQSASINDLFFGFRAQSNKALAISTVFILLNTVCLTPYQIFFDLYRSSLDAKWAIYMLISMGIGLLIYIPLFLGLSQAFFLMLDFPEKNARDTLKLSMQIMKGHRCRLLYIGASFIPLMLLCLLSFGIGFLWLTPYMYMTMTQFFLDLMNPEKKMD